MSKAKDYRTTQSLLNEIIRRLENGDILSVKELANEFGKSERTIQRYFNSYLQEAGFPLKKIGKKWAIRGSRAMMLDEETQLALETLEEMAKEVGAEFYAKFKKVLAKIHPITFNPIYTKLDMEDISDKFEEITVIEKAIKQKKVLHCIYQFDDKHVAVDIKPLRIACFEGFWYVLALDARNDIFKKYYLKHITKPKIGKECFSLAKEFEANIKNAINVWFDPDTKPFEVVLFADSVACKYLKRKPLSNTQYISGEDGDGSCEIRIKITDYMEIIPFIQSWLPHIRVIEPEELDEIVRVNIREYLSM